MHPAPAREYVTSPGLVIAGFDPSIASAGLCVIERRPNGYRKLHHKVIKTSSAKPIPARVGAIADHLSSVFREYHPSLLVVEEQLGVQTGKRREGEGFNSDSPKTVGAAYAAMCCAHLFGLSVVEVHPATAKVAVLGRGGGKAEKKRVQQVVASILGERLALDASDAAAMAIYGFQLSPNERRKAG